MFLKIFFVSLFFSTQVYADNAGTPLKFIKNQGRTSHCWAYAASHMIESIIQSKNGYAVPFDVEAGLHFYTFKNRLMKRILLSHPLCCGLDDQYLFSTLGLPMEYWSIYFEHGSLLRFSDFTPKNMPLNELQTKLISLNFKMYPEKTVNITQSDLAALIAQFPAPKNTDIQAVDLAVTQFLNKYGYFEVNPKTSFMLRDTTAPELIPEFFGPNIKDWKNQKFVLMGVTNKSNPQLTFIPDIGEYGTYTLEDLTKQELLDLVSLSFEMGLPVLEASSSHVWALLGSFYESNSTEKKYLAIDSAFSKARLSNLDDISYMILENVVRAYFKERLIEPKVTSNNFNTSQMRLHLYR